MTIHCTKMAPTVTRSQPNRASLGCGGTGPPNNSLGDCTLIEHYFKHLFRKNKTIN